MWQAGNCWTVVGVEYWHRPSPLFIFVGLLNLCLFFSSAHAISVFCCFPRYMNVPINDAENVDIMKYFGETNKFLLSCVRNGGRALIHCRAGVCRSTTILTAFLMYFETWRLVPTLNYLRVCRFIIHPNNDFKQQLVLYELLMFGKSSVKPYLSTQEWGMYKLRALLNRSGIESWIPDRTNFCAIQ